MYNKHETFNLLYGNVGIRGPRPHNSTWQTVSEAIHPIQTA